jgi:hypothetical protein
MKPATLERLLLCAVLGACQAALAASTLIKDVRVFDGQAMHEHRSVLFDKGVIVDADFRGAAPQGAGVIEGAGRTLLPGLIGAQDPLSERERQVLRLAGEGRSSADIARQVHLSEGTGCATTCPKRSVNSAPRTGSKPTAWRATPAGSDRVVRRPAR